MIGADRLRALAADAAGTKRTKAAVVAAVAADGLAIPKAIRKPRAAVAAGADGIIVEVHPNPDEAICDGPQALHASEFAGYVERLERAAELAGKALSSVPK